MPEVNFDLYHSQLDRCYSMALDGNAADRALAIKEHCRITEELGNLEIPIEERHVLARKVIIHTEHLAAAGHLPCDEASVEAFIALTDKLWGYGHSSLGNA